MQPEMIVRPPSRLEMGYIYPKTYIMGVDLGQSADPTAIAVIEVERRVRCFYDGMSYDIRQQPEGAEYRVRHLERLPLRTAYPAQVAYVAGLLREPELKGCEVVIDETGVGRPVADLFEGGGLRPHRVTITAGMEEVRAGERSWRVAKILLVSRLQAVLNTGELRLSPDLAELRALKTELSEFRMRYTPAGGAVFGAREGRHDDLVLALALALWRAQWHARGPQLQQARLWGV